MSSQSLKQAANPERAQTERRFCKALWFDDKGPYCSTRAAESLLGCDCPYKAKDCHVVSRQIGDQIKKEVQCGGEKIGIPTFEGVCQDFDPSDWLKEKLGV